MVTKDGRAESLELGYRRFHRPPAPQVDRGAQRTLSWLMRDRRLSKDYERKVQISETFIEVSMIRLMLKRLTR